MERAATTSSAALEEGRQEEGRSESLGGPLGTLTSSAEARTFFWRGEGQKSGVAGAWAVGTALWFRGRTNSIEDTEKRGPLR